MKIELKALLAATSALSLLGFSSPARAVNLVQNGDFESVTSVGQIGRGRVLQNWTSADRTGFGGNFPSLNIVYAANTIDSTGAPTVGGAAFKTWGPANGENNGLQATSPTGGNFLAMDGDVNERGALSQTINGLTIGEVYTLSFYEGAAQELGFRGATTEQIQVTFGNNTYTTPLLNTPDKGAQPWRFNSFSTTATSTSQVLSFLALGTPSGKPPISLLDGVSVATAVPEPLTIIGTIVGGSTALSLRKRLSKSRK